MPEPGGPPTSSEIVFYQGEDGRSRIQVRLDGATVWLTQRLLAELYQVTVPTISEHLDNLFEEGELDPGATVRKFRIVQPEGKREVFQFVDHDEAKKSAEQDDGLFFEHSDEEEATPAAEAE